MRFIRKEDGIDFFVEPFFRFWDIKTSDEAQLTSEGGSILWYGDPERTIPATGVEPDNNTTEYGLKLGLIF